jgi:hypothetical protein
MTVSVLRGNLRQTMLSVSDEEMRRVREEYNHAGVTADAPLPAWLPDTPKRTELALLRRMLLKLDSQLQTAERQPAYFRPWIMQLCGFWVGVARNAALKANTSELSADETALAAFLHAERPSLAAFEQEDNGLAWKIAERRNAVFRSDPPLTEALQALYDELCVDVGPALVFLDQAYMHVRNYAAEMDGVVSPGMRVPLTAVMLGWIQTSYRGTFAEARRRFDEIRTHFLAIEAEIRPDGKRRRTESENLLESKSRRLV